MMMMIKFLLLRLFFFVLLFLTTAITSCHGKKQKEVEPEPDEPEEEEEEQLIIPLHSTAVWPTYSSSPSPSITTSAVTTSSPAPTVASTTDNDVAITTSSPAPTTPSLLPSRPPSAAADGGGGSGSGAAYWWKYYIDEQFIGFADLFLDADSFSVTDENQREVYVVDGGTFDWIDDLTLRDSRSGRKLYQIQHEVLESWLSLRDLYTILPSAVNNIYYYQVEKGGNFISNFFGSKFHITSKLVSEVDDDDDDDDDDSTSTGGGELLYTAVGDFWGSDFEILQQNQKNNNKKSGSVVVATVQKKSSTIDGINLGDYYELSVLDNEDAALMLCVSIVIDQMLHDDSGEINSPGLLPGW